MRILAITLPLMLLVQLSFSQVVENGRANLSAIDFRSNEPIQLDGQWHFKFNQFLTWNDVFKLEADSSADQIDVPSIWTGKTIGGKELPGTGFATYWLKLKLPENHPKLAFKIKDASNACRIYLDDSLLSEVGVAGKSKATTIPNSRSHVIPFHTDKTEVVLRIQMANFHYRVGGLWESIWIGEAEKLRAEHFRVTLQTMLIIGIALAFMCYHLLLFFLRKRNQSTLFFALFCFVIAVRMFSTDNMIILDIFPSLSWFWRIRLDVFSFYLSIPAALLFSVSVFKDDFPKLISKIAMGIGFAATALCLITPANIYSQLIPPYRFYAFAIFILLVIGLVSAIKNNREGAKTYALGYVVILICSANDILLGANLINSTEIVSYGIIVLLIVKSLLLARQYARAFQEAESLSIALKDANKMLEQKVQERTAEIERKNYDLADKNRLLTVSEEELKQNAEELKVINDNLAKAKLEIEEMFLQEQKNLNQLKSTQVKLIQAEKMASLGQMTAGIAHEINNPINFVSGGVQGIKLVLEELARVFGRYEKLKNYNSIEDLIKGIESIKVLEEEISINEAKKEALQLLRDIELGATRTAEIVKGLQRFSRSDDTSITAIDIHEGINATLVILKHKFKRKEVEVLTDYATEMPMISCYSSQLNQVFMNLIANAIDAVEKGGKIKISTKVLEEAIKITISDNGVGMSEEVKSQIFDPFFTTKEIGKGTGLGLSISYGIIEKHQGEITVESEFGQGTSFIITLPKGLSPLNLADDLAQK